MLSKSTKESADASFPHHRRYCHPTATHTPYFLHHFFINHDLPGCSSFLQTCWICSEGGSRKRQLPLPKGGGGSLVPRNSAFVAENGCQSEGARGVLKQRVRLSHFPSDLGPGQGGLSRWSVGQEAGQFHRDLVSRMKSWQGQQQSNFVGSSVSLSAVHPVQRGAGP